MPPIKIYADAPLHPDAITPQTAAAQQPEQEQERAPQPTAATTTTRTTRFPSDASLPPPPQPGARPQPPASPTSTYTPSSPAPPQPGPLAYMPHTVVATHTITTTGQLPHPRQLSVPSPMMNQAPSHSTYVPYASPFEDGASSLPLSPEVRHVRAMSLQHPPGYQQNPFAADGTASDRARFELAARQAEEEEGVLGKMKTWVFGASEKLTRLEDEAWKLAKGK